jgi:hypothetical protein
LLQIEKQAFSATGLIAIVIPASVEIFGARCFAQCRSLSSIAFESESKLREIDLAAFTGVIVVPTLPTRKFNH